MYRAHRISGHPMSAMRISALAGVRAPVTHVASAEVPMTHRANATYDGTITMLNAAARPSGLNVVNALSSSQKTTTGRAARPQTIVSTTRIETTVTASRQTTAAFHRVCDTDAFVIAPIL